MSTNYTIKTISATYEDAYEYMFRLWGLHRDYVPNPATGEGRHYEKESYLSFFRRWCSDNHIEITKTMVDACGYEGENDPRFWDDPALTKCCCGSYYTTPYANECDNCGEEERCYSCAVGGDADCCANDSDSD